MEITQEMISKLAELSRLSFTAEELQSLKPDLQNMLSLIDKINELNLDQVEPLVYINESENVFRNDEQHAEITLHQALQNANVHTDVFFQVPKVINR